MSSRAPSEPNRPLDDAQLTNIPFQDRDTAVLNLSRIAQRVTPPLAAAIPTLLVDAPDPDSALILFDRLVSESSSQVASLLASHPELAHYAIVIFGHSRFLGETLIQNPDLLQFFLRDKSLDQSSSREEFEERLARYRSRAFETDLSLLLARFKRREYVRILLRDVLKLASLAETTAEISALADVLIEEARREADSELQSRYGTPQHLNADGRVEETPFAVLSLGKLGANELNYSSDVDLMYLFGDGAEPTTASISNREYFIRLAQRITEILSRATQEGLVFRIDLRLRPQGGEGELALCLGQALRYYATTAHDWERQALIKVRHSAGAAALARQFIRGVQPYVYTEEVNFAAIKTALAAREKMQAGRRQRSARISGEGIDVKIDSGGIRDIEFLVQCLQRVYGGAEPWLRSSGTLFSLQKLHDKRHLSGGEFHELTGAYEFLRHVEHRLQLRYGQQTHRIPLARPELQILQRAMECCVPEEIRDDHFVVMVERWMAAVAEIYRRIIYQQQSRQHDEAQHAEFQLHPSSETWLPGHSNEQVLEQLARDAPALYETATRDDLNPVARSNLFRFLTAAFTSSERYATIRRHADAIAPSLILFEASEYLTGILVRHPEEIATMAKLGTMTSRIGGGYLFENPLGQRRTTDPVFAYLASSTAGYGEKLALLRRHYRHRVFAAGAKDLAEFRDVYTSLGENTSAAEDAIAAAFEIAGPPEGLAIMALGRLGSGEFDVLSDADLLFIGEEDRQNERLTASTSQIVQVLAAYTQEGLVFPVDARLRPRGGEGELVVTPKQLARYFEHEAQAWEALSYTKLRLVAGSPGLGEQVSRATDVLFHRFARETGFSQSVREMRAKLESADGVGKNFKTSAGTIYDIDFLCGFLLVQNGVANKGGSLRDRLWRCAALGLLEKADTAMLDHAAELLRTVDHVVRLVIGRPAKWLPVAGHARQVTERMTGLILHREFPNGLETELERNCREVRKIYDRVLASPTA